MGRNPTTCPHNMTEFEDGDEYCVECGIVFDEPVEDEGL